jgi:heme oxygenase
MTESHPNFADSLKSGTAKDHQETEAHPFQSRLGGDISLTAYRAYLASLQQLHHAIDQRLVQLGSRADRLRELLPFHRHRVEMLRIDLEELSQRSGDSSKPGDNELAAWIAGLNEAGLAGVLYVIEGSANGGHYAAKGLRAALGFSAVAGTRFLDPHGDDQHPMWREYKQALNRLELNEAEQERAVEAARRCFRAFAEASDRADQVDR